jgi:hypothetical protein
MIQEKIISYKNIKGIRGTLAYWFANAACQVLLGQRECDLAGETYDYLPEVAANLELIRDELERLKEKEYAHIFDRKSREIKLEDAISILTSPITQEKFLYAPPDLFLEYGEYLEGFLDTSTLKRDKIFVSDIIVSLAVLGAATTFSYSISRENRRVYGYIGYSGLPSAGGSPTDRYFAARRISGTVGVMARHDPPWEAVELAAASVLVKEGLRPSDWDTFEVVEAYRGGNKIVIASYRVSHISALASSINRGFAQGFLELVERYGNKAVKRVADHIARGIYMYSLYRDPQYLHQALRPLMSRDIDDRMKGVVSSWEDVVDRILQWGWSDDR